MASREEGEESPVGTPKLQSCRLRKMRCRSAVVERVDTRLERRLPTSSVVLWPGRVGETKVRLTLHEEYLLLIDDDCLFLSSPHRLFQPRGLARRDVGDGEPHAGYRCRRKPQQSMLRLLWPSN